MSVWVENSIYQKKTVSQENGLCDKRQNDWSQESKVEVVWKNAKEIGVGTVRWVLMERSFVLIQKRERSHWMISSSRVTDKICILKRLPWLWCNENGWDQGKTRYGEAILFVQVREGGSIEVDGVNGKGLDWSEKCESSVLSIVFETMCVDRIPGKGFTVRRDDLQMSLEWRKQI